MEENLSEILKKRVLEKKALDTMYESEAGAIVRANLADTLAQIVQKLAGNYRTMTHQEMIAEAARMDAIFQVSSLLKNAKKDEEALRDTTE
jgi:hypothetical protein